MLIEYVKNNIAQRDIIWQTKHLYLTTKIIFLQTKHDHMLHFVVFNV